MTIFYQPRLTHGITFLEEEESRHCVKVLRLKDNDIIQVVDGVGGLYKARIINAVAKKCEFEVIEKNEAAEKKYHIHIAIAATKNADRIEWFVEKSVEVGIDEITFLSTANSERKKINRVRIIKKAISAMKQSKKAAVPEIHEMVALSHFIPKLSGDTWKFIAYVDKDIPQHLKEAAESKHQYVVLIGPEGDFTSEEIDLALKNNFIPVSLGKSRLRTETAGLIACHTLNLINE